ncbi:MAG: dephospho-CoA kinase, partial [Candidatus Diapherotrites archaeon]
MNYVLLGLPSGGKTTVLNKLRKHGFKGIDSDKIVEKLYRKKKVIELIAINFGTKIIDSNGEVNKEKLRKI